MINIDEFIKQLDDSSSTKVEAAIYARVSTRNESQKDSCENQVKTAKEFIETKQNISLSDNNILVDDGYSGKSVTKRKNYQELMGEVSNHEINLIIVKTSSRLFRSVVESQNFMNALLKNDVVLYTLDENHYWNFNNQSDILSFTLNSVMNAGTSKTQSDAAHEAQNRRKKDKTLWPKDLVPGFKWNGNDIEVDEELSPYIKEIFKDYVYRNATPASICKSFKERNITFPEYRKNKETKESELNYKYLSERTISSILTNEKYIGKFTINKRSSTFILGEEAKRYILPESEWVVVDRTDLRIIDDELFELAQRIHKARAATFNPDKNGNIQSRFQGINTFAAKIKCPICGKNYIYKIHNTQNAIPYYYHPNKDDCPNPIKSVFEPDIESITKQALKQAIGQADDICASLEHILKDAVKKSQNNDGEISNLKRKLTEKEQYQNNILKMLDKLQNEDAISSAATNYDKVSEEISQLKAQLSFKESNKLNDSYVSDTIKKINASIENLKNFTSIDRNRVQNYINIIELHPNGDIEMFLNSSQILIIEAVHDDIEDTEDNNFKILLAEFVYEKSVRTPKRHLIKEPVTVRCFLKTYPPSTPIF